MTKHTEGPWEVRGYRGDRPIVAETPKGQVHVASVYAECEYAPRLPAEANAERIVACVNAMEGIEDPQEYVENVGILVEEKNKVRAQRDALLEAAKFAVRYVDRAIGAGPEAEKELRAAIAKCEELNPPDDDEPCDWCGRDPCQCPEYDNMAEIDREYEGGAS